MGARIGVQPKQALPFGTHPVAPGVIAVQPEVDLAPGEYGFVQTSAGVGTGAAQVATTSARVYDFAVASAAMASRAADAGLAHAWTPEPPVENPLIFRAVRIGPVRPRQVQSKAQQAAGAPSNYPGGH